MTTNNPLSFSAKFQQDKTALFATIAGMLSATLGIIVLTGWALDIAVLRSFIRGAVEMKANTAFGLLLSGCVLIVLANRTSLVQQYVAQAAAVIVLALGFGTLGEYVFSWQLGIDELLFKDTGNAFNLIPGRMSPYSAITFGGIGIMLAALQRPRLRPLVQLLALLVIILGAISVIGYLWNASEIVTDAILPPIAINTAIGFFFLGLGTLLVARKRVESSDAHLLSRNSIEFKLLFSFIGTLFLLIFTGGHLYRSAAAFAEAEKWVSHTHEVRAHLSNLYSPLSDAESAQRNYLLTGDRQYKAVLQQDSDQIRNQIQTLRSLMTDNPAQLESLAKLEILISQRISAMNRISNLFDMQGFEAARKAIIEGAEPQLRTGIYELTKSMGDLETKLLATRQQSVERERQNTLIALLMTIVSVTAIFVFLFYSITIEKNLRETREKELVLAKAEADKANQAKSSFLSSMSHELRTPLNAILGFAQILASNSFKTTEPQQKEFSSHILQAGQHLLTLINDILDLAKVESGMLMLSLESVEIDSLLQECKTMIEPMAAQRKISLVFPAACGFNVIADRTRLTQVLLNLMSNATKYNREMGAIVISCDITTTDRIRIKVQDTGKGLRPEQVDALFQPFNRLGQETGAIEGTGIGLVVTKRLVELMGGSISVTSTVDIGSAFWIELPIAIPPQKQQLNEVVSTAVVNNDVSATATPRTLLYVEDNPANLKLVEELLRFRSGLQLISAPDAHKGIEIASTQLPDLILLDINLPGMNGYDARKILIANPKTAHIPVIALTANAMPRDIKKGQDAGFFRYLTKPINIDEFTDAIDSALKLLP
jgi:signal transduction histidine kinase/ActR/RegA family two-component response regulator